jgi:vancomycin resistance protein VanW
MRCISPKLKEQVPRRDWRWSRASKKIMRLRLFLIFFISTGFLAAVLYLHRPFHHRMAAYVTDLSGRTFEQRVNIRKAGAFLSETIMKTGETLSLNDTAGPFTRERGFLPERGFVEKSLVLSPGGGVCQLASTLYNAARLAGLEIEEKVSHSRPVRSVPPGWDATLAYGVADLKLKNPYPFPVKIVSKIVQDQLQIEIWGKESSHDVLKL